MIKNGKISISESEWEALNKSHTKDEIKKMISDAIEQNNVPMPMREIKKLDAEHSFDELCELPIHGRIIDTEWFTRYDYKYPLTPKVIKAINVGNIASDYFQQSVRWECDSINAPSPFRTWHTEKFRLTLLSGLWSLKYKKVEMSDLRTLIGLRKYIAAQFRPSSAKIIYEHFNARHILDFSSGWGDRLCGFLATESTISYTGIDPNVKLVDGYKKQIEMFDVDNKEISMIVGSAEDPSGYPENKKYDLIFTSPPYFNIERYNTDDTQSYKKYKKIDIWLNEFLFKAIDNAWQRLEVGGHLIINISDVYSNHTINRICDPMNDFISKYSDAEYVGCWGYEMRKRPNSGALKNKQGVFAEPIWIWKKV